MVQGRVRVVVGVLLACVLVASLVAPLAVGTPVANAAVGYRALTPSRILDTRTTGPVGADSHIDVQVTGVGGVPDSGVGAVVLNVTATSPTADTWVTVWPTGQGRPEASNLNVSAGETRPNLVIATVGDGGKVSLYNFAGATHLIADVTGWFPAASDYHGLTPSRILDTRTTGPVGADSHIEVQVTGVGGVPASGVGAVVLNVTATGPTADTWVTAWPSGSARPEASSLNVAAGQTAPNLVIATVGAGGKVSLYNFAGATHLIADVAGWFPAGSDYHALTPSRILDTRTTGPVGADSHIDVQVTGVGGVPATGVGAVVLNVTATGASTDTWVTAWPAGQPRPEASTLNVATGVDIPNAVIATVGADGKVSLYNFAGATHLIADVTGWLPGVPAGGGPGHLIWTDRVQTFRTDLGELASYAHMYEMPVIAPKMATGANLVQRELAWPDWPCGLCDHQVVVRDLDSGAPVDTFTWPEGIDRDAADTSPDGRYVAAFTWTNSTTEPSRITIVDRATRNVATQLIATWAGTWAWTPESDLIWVVPRGDRVDEPDRFEIVRIPNAEIGKPTPSVTLLFEIEVTIKGLGDPWLSDVSADGTQLLYTYGGQLWAASTTPGSKPHQLTTGPYTHAEGVFSPDASEVAFVNKVVYTGEVNVIPNHRGAPIHIPHSGGDHELVVGIDERMDAYQILAWEP